MSETRTVMISCARCGRVGTACMPVTKPASTWHRLQPTSEGFYERVRPNGLGTEVACFICETNAYPLP